jgi:hypothetical protein
MKLKEIYSNYKTVFQNLKYISLLEIFVVFAPLITYPYLIKRLTTEFYVHVIFSNIIVGYFTILVNFGLIVLEKNLYLKIYMIKESFQKQTITYDNNLLEIKVISKRFALIFSTCSL